MPSIFSFLTYLFSFLTYLVQFFNVFSDDDGDDKCDSNDSKAEKATKCWNVNMQNYAEEQNMQNDNDDDDKPSCGVTPATQSTPQLEWRRFRDEKRKYFWEMRKHRDHEETTKCQIYLSNS